MSKRPSLTYQIQQTLMPMFERGYGRGRHEDKMNARHLGKDTIEATKQNIYSGNSYRSNLQKCNTIFKFCKHEFGLRYIQEIKPEHFSEFIKRGSQTGMPHSVKTAEQYKNALDKLQTGYNQQNKTEYKFYDNTWKQATVHQPKQREKMPREIHDQIIQRAAERKPENGHAFSIARACGLRVSEVTNLRLKDFRLGADGKIKEVHIHKSKGGRSRNIEVDRLNARYRDSVQKVYEQYKELEPESKLFNVKPDSLSKAFLRHRDALTGGEYKQCGFHSMRKEFAQDYIINMAEQRGVYLTEKDDLMSSATRDELQDLSEALGHDRIDVLEAYLR